MSTALTNRDARAIRLLDYCPYYADGSRAGVGSYIHAVVNAYAGALSLETISYVFRTTYTQEEFHSELERRLARAEEAEV